MINGIMVKNETNHNPKPSWMYFNKTVVTTTTNLILSKKCTDMEIYIHKNYLQKMMTRLLTFLRWSGCILLERMHQQSSNW